MIKSPVSVLVRGPVETGCTVIARYVPFAPETHSAVSIPGALTKAVVMGCGGVSHWFRASDMVPAAALLPVGKYPWPEERAKYGVTPNMPIVDHVNAAENFLRDRGVKPGMGLLDIYSTINAGRPGLYDRSDANNGGAPGTVADKVATQMVGHRARANAILGDNADSGAQAPPPVSASPNPSPTTSAASAPSGMPSQEPDAGTPDLPSIGSAISKATPQAPQPEIDTPMPSGLPVAQRLAAIMQRLQVAQNGS